MKLYTGTGDNGKTFLPARTGISKNNPRIKAIGAVDELNSFVGLARSIGDYDAELLAKIQTDLFSVGAELAGADKNFEKITEKSVVQLEQEADKIGSQLSTLHNFVLPGGTQYAATLHVCRSVCRRAERSVVKLEESENVSLPEIKVYLNRLSSLFFGLALAENKRAGVKETEWRGKGL